MCSASFPRNVLAQPHKSMPANPLLADPMYWAGYIEKVGTGTEDIIGKCAAYGLPAPEYSLDADFRVIIWRRQTGIAATEKTTEKILSLIKSMPEITMADLAKTLNLSEDGIYFHIKKMRENGIGAREGGRKNGLWKIIKSNV